MRSCALALLAGLTASAPASETAAPVMVAVEVTATPELVWEKWTTDRGARSFFAPDTRIEPRVGGVYEIYFLPHRRPGLRGSETATILAFEPPSRLMVSWNAPEEFGPLRDQLTVVEISIEPIANGQTRVTLTHSGWGTGARWSALRNYFASAWPFVLKRFQASLDPHAAGE